MEIGGLRSQPWATAYGEFDPVNGVGDLTDNLAPRSATPAAPPPASETFTP